MLSIIIPTYKRPEILRQCLEHIEKQSVLDQLEVVIVSDGHDDNARQVAEARWNVTVRYFEIEKSQQGVARNKGVQQASSEFCLFIGDDAFLAPDACEKHLNALQKNSGSAVLGFTTWDPSVGITPVMQWLEQSGWQFGYPSLQKYAHTYIPTSLQHQYTYTIHISLPTQVAKALPFREDITRYGWEDIEWGQRLAKQGIKLFYEPDAKALHHHHMTLEQSLKRMETLGKSLVHMEQLVPTFTMKPTRWKLIAYRIAALLPTMSGKHRKAFLRGLR